MLFTEYLLAFIKVAFQIAFAIVSAIPMRIAYNCVASNYFSDLLPEKFLQIPYWHFVAFLLVIILIGESIKKLTPKIVNIKQDVGSVSE